MKHVRSFGFEALETRMLLSRGHVATAHHARAVAAPAPVVLDGTLSVDSGAAVVEMDDEGDSITETPVSGQLGALGEVHGVWDETFDEYGDYLGPDTIELHNAKGTIVIGFNDQAEMHVHKVAHGSVSYEYAQRFITGAGAYARASETGTIDLVTDTPRTSIQSMEIQTGKS